MYVWKKRHFRHSCRTPNLRTVAEERIEWRSIEENREAVVESESESKSRGARALATWAQNIECVLVATR